MSLVVVAILLALNCALASKNPCKSFFEKRCGGKRKENLNQNLLSPQREEVRSLELESVSNMNDDDKQVKEKSGFYKNPCTCNISLTSVLNDVDSWKTDKNPIHLFARKESKQSRKNPNILGGSRSIKKIYNPKEFDNEHLKVAAKKNRNYETSLMLVKEENGDDDMMISTHFMNDSFKEESQWGFADHYDSPRYSNVEKFEFPKLETSEERLMESQDDNDYDSPKECTYNFGYPETGQERLMRLYKERLLEVRTLSASSASASDDDEEEQVQVHSEEKEDRIEDATAALFYIGEAADLLTFKANIKEDLNKYESVEETEVEKI